jgi:hypothetical protein
MAFYSHCTLKDSIRVMRLLGLGQKAGMKRIWHYVKRP